ncbi:GTP-binding protein REM 1-like [Babylonia areolata]|uniref:GTP-binding protein REM 1-like n=1 Tax=Babylonia areolata TaxID=304850 RepID=UPI003FD23DDC
MSTGSTAATDLSTSTTAATTTTTTTTATATATATSLPARPRALSTASEESSSGVVSWSGSYCAPSYFRVALLGSPGVGKSALIRQFMSSEYRGTFDIVTPDAEDPETTVSVMLDGEESMIEFIDQPQESELDSLRADAFVVVFSLADQASFSGAVSTVRHLRLDLGTDRAILMVANKVDLARQRRVHLADARAVAAKYDCRLEETSAALNHQVDELLVSILSHIRLRLTPPPLPPHPSDYLSSSSPLLPAPSPPSWARSPPAPTPSSPARSAPRPSHSELCPSSPSSLHRAARRRPGPATTSSSSERKASGGDHLPPSFFFSIPTKCMTGCVTMTT